VGARRANGKRAAQRDAVEGIVKILELNAKGLSPAAMAGTLPITSEGVRRILELLLGEDEADEEAS
jgi:hypothetical protein